MSHFFAILTLFSRLEVRPAIGKNPPTVILQHQDTPITNLELLNKVPKRGEGVEVKGVLKTPSHRLVATSLQPVPLPPIHEDAGTGKPPENNVTKGNPKPAKPKA